MSRIFSPLFRLPAWLAVAVLLLSCEDPRESLPAVQRLERQFVQSGSHYVLTQVAESFDLQNNVYVAGVYEAVLPKGTTPTVPKNRIRLFSVPPKGLPRLLKDLPSATDMPCEADLTHFRDNDDNGKPDLLVDCPSVQEDQGKTHLLELSGQSVRSLAEALPGRFTREARTAGAPVLLGERLVCLRASGSCENGGVFHLPLRIAWDGTDYRKELPLRDDPTLLSEAYRLERQALEVLRDISACSTVWHDAAKAAFLRIVAGETATALERHRVLLKLVQPRCGSASQSDYDLPADEEDLPAWKTRRSLDSVF